MSRNTSRADSSSIVPIVIHAGRARVHSLAFRNVAEIAHKVRRKHAALTVRTIAGRRHVFHDLRPHTAATIERLVIERPGG